MGTADQHANHQGQLLRSGIAVSVLAGVFVILRIVARSMKRVAYGSDDYTLLLALVILYATMGIYITMIHYGMGRHKDDLSDYANTMIFKLLYAFELTYVTSIAVVKLSILIMYYRIFPIRSLRLGAWIIGFIVGAWFIAINTAVVFQCTPLRRAWDYSLPGHCLYLRGLYVGNAVPNFTTDFIILALPIPHLWRLQTSIIQRLSVIGIFLLGSFVIFASVYRFTTLFGFEISDTPWTVATPLLWCLIEISAAIISACLPTLRPILRHISSGFDSSQAKSRTAGTDIVLGQTSRTNPTSTTHGYHRQDDTNLRPDYNKMASDVRVKRESRGDGESDEMPLHPYEIMVSRELHWTEERSSDNSNSNSGDNIRQ